MGRFSRFLCLLQLLDFAVSQGIILDANLQLLLDQTYSNATFQVQELCFSCFVLPLSLQSCVSSKILTCNYSQEAIQDYQLACLHLNLTDPFCVGLSSNSFSKVKFTLKLNLNPRFYFLLKIRLPSFQALRVIILRALVFHIIVA